MHGGDGDAEYGIMLCRLRNEQASKKTRWGKVGWFMQGEKEPTAEKRSRCSLFQVKNTLALRQAQAMPGASKNDHIV
jgi:hypothetical protein